MRCVHLFFNDMFIYCDLHMWLDRSNDIDGMMLQVRQVSLRASGTQMHSKPYGEM